MRACNGAYKFNEGGWTYVHLQGAPEQVGFQHGYLLAQEIEDNVLVYQVEAPQHDEARMELLSRCGKECACGRTSTPNTSRS